MNNLTKKQEWISFSMDILKDEELNPYLITSQGWDAYGEFLAERYPEGPNGSECRQFARAFYYSLVNNSGHVYMTSELARCMGILYVGLSL